jgi:5-methylcytosine-specific restriction endonuclease McrA
MAVLRRRYSLRASTMENKEEDTLADLKRIIREASYDNSYKMAWAKAIVEKCVFLRDKAEINNVFSLRDIASLMIKYYWNQTIFFHLIQGSNISKPPLLLQLTEDLIDSYIRIVDSSQPVIYEKAILTILAKEDRYYQSVLDKALWVVKKDVSYRFTHLDDKEVTSLYQYTKGEDTLSISGQNVRLLAENSQDLFDLINYRWSLILETFNSSPRINKKVRIMEERDVRRSPLERFDKFLNIENPNHICFICGKQIADEELSRDHVIPWSYLYSDDLWNLVYVHKSCNSVKSNVLPNDNSIERLKKRNDILLDDLTRNQVYGKDYDELVIAVKKDLVDQFYIGCKG